LKSSAIVEFDAVHGMNARFAGLTSLTQRSRATRRIPVRKCFIGTAPLTLVEKQRFSALFGIEMLANYGA
jgi:hypothetical protein